jgi:Zn-dependent protease
MGHGGPFGAVRRPTVSPLDPSPVGTCETIDGVLGGRSIQLARVFGVRIGVDASWFVVLFLIIWSLSGSYGALFPGDDTLPFVLATVSALLFFTSVVLHELGHAWVAMRGGIRITGIDLWLFGGVAKMSRDTDSAGLEFKVAVAGPLVTLLISVACLVGVSAGGGVEAFRGLAGLTSEGYGPVDVVLAYLCLINVLLLVFNLIPGFPLDGGRIARAVAWKVTGDRARATRFAAALGRGFSFILAGLGIYLLLRGVLVSGLWLVFIALFLGQAARSAVLQARVTAPLQDLRVSDVMDAEPVVVPGAAPLERVEEEFFLRYGWSWFPVVDAGGRLLGILTRTALEAVPHEEWPDRRASDTAAFEDDAAVGLDEPVEALLAFDGLRRLGALLAVDGDGTLRGIVTLQQVRRALSPMAPAAPRA